MQGARDGAGGDHQAEVVAQQLGHRAMRQAQWLVEDHDQGNGPRSKLHRGRSQGVRGLQGMAPLYPSPTRRAVTDPDIELAHDRHHDRQVFLKLPRQARRGHGAGTVRTHWRHRHRDDLVHVRRRRSVTVASMAGPGAAPAPPRPRRRRALREGAAWRVPARRARPSSRFSRSFSRRNRSRSRSSFARSRSARSKSRRNRSFSRSRSREGADRSGTSRLCQIPDKSTS